MEFRLNDLGKLPGNELLETAKSMGEKASDLDQPIAIILEGPEQPDSQEWKNNWPKRFPSSFEKTEANGNDSGENTNKEGLTDEEKEQIKKETGWSDVFIDHIENMKQYEVLKNADLVEADIGGRKCLIKQHIDYDYTDKDGVSNRERMAHGLPPLDSKTGKPIELHHLGQKPDSPLVELTEEEHRTGDYEDGKKNQSLWHDNSKETEVHGEGNNWDHERKEHWKARSEQIEE